MKWFLKWRLRRAEARLAIAREYRDACEEADDRHSGVYLDSVLDAMEIEQRAQRKVDALRKRVSS